MEKARGQATPPPPRGGPSTRCCAGSGSSCARRAGAASTAATSPTCSTSPRPPPPASTPSKPTAAYPPPARACRVVSYVCRVVGVASRADGGGCSVQWLVRDGKPLPPLKRMLCGALAGITSTTLTYPLGTHVSTSPASRFAVWRWCVQWWLTPSHSCYSTHTHTHRPGADAAGRADARHADAVPVQGDRGLSGPDREAGGTSGLLEGPLRVSRRTFSVCVRVRVARVVTIDGQGIAPFVAINFTTFETLRQEVTERHGGQMPLLWGPVCGAASGTFAMTCTPQPFTHDTTHDTTHAHGTHTMPDSPPTVQARTHLICCDGG